MLSGSIRPIRRVVAPVRDQVQQMLSSAILAGSLLPGDRIIERKICEMTGASRASVREALRHLESQGLVTAIPNRGIVVTRTTADEAENIYELRAVLEGLAARRCASNATESQLSELQRCLKNFADAAHSGNRSEALAIKNEFYECLLESSGNKFVADVHRALQGRIVALRAVSLSTEGRLNQSLAEITRIVDAIVARDGTRAERESIHHVLKAGSIAVDAVRARDEVTRTTSNENQ